MFRGLWDRLFGPRPKSLQEQLQERTQQLQLKMLESASASYEYDFVNPAEPLYDTPDFWPAFGYGERLPVNLDNRAKGEVLPIYLTEYGLKINRDRCRYLLAFNEFAINAIENRVSYIVGKGLQYKAVPVDAGGDMEGGGLDAAAQRVIDDFCERNEWGELEQEAVRRCDRDGECFLRFFHVGQGRCEVRFVEPEWVRSQAGQDAAHSFGVQTDADDTEHVVGFWIAENPAESLTPSFVAADEVVHIKLNSDRNAKRGVPTLLPIRKNLDRADKLLRNMTTLAQVQATFALIRRHKNFPNSAVSAFQQNADLMAQDPVSGNTKYMTQLQPGSIIDTSQNTEYEFPSATVNAGNLVQVLQAELRAVAARLVMPEYMLTADASNANYSSTLVAAAPAVKNFERLQALFARHFGDGRYSGGGRCGVMWRVIRYAVEYGGLNEAALTRLAIQVEGPTLTAVDKSQETSRAATLNEKGVLSKATWSKWEGLDRKQEERQIQTEAPPEPPPGEQPPDGGDGNPPAPDDGSPPDDFAEAVARILEGRDASGHEHGKDGKFGSGGGESAPSEAYKDTIAKLRAAKAARAGGKPAGFTSAAASSADHSGHVVDAIKAHGKQLVPMPYIRAHLASKGITDRKDQDAAIHSARVKGHVSGSNFEGHGYHGKDREDMVAALHRGKNGDERIGYLAMRTAEALEACVPNQGGKGHHDDKTGHPCKDGSGKGGKAKPSVADLRGKVKAGKTWNKRIKASKKIARAVTDKIVQSALGRGVKAVAGSKVGRGVAVAAKATKWLAKRIGHEVWDTFDPDTQKSLIGVGRVAMAVDHALEKYTTHLGQQLVKEVAKERGLKLKQQNFVAKVTSVADTVAKWTVNIPAVHAGIEAAELLAGPAAFMAAKVGYYVPVASLAYIGYSTVRNPMATVRAARTVIASLFSGKGHQQHAHEAVKPAYDRAAIAALCDGLAGAKDGEWFMALLSAALDHTHDLSAAVAMAVKASEGKPINPAGDSKDYAAGDLLGGDSE